MDDLDVEMLTDGGNFEVETGSRDELRGIEQKDTALNKGRGEVGGLGESRDYRGGAGRWTLVPRVYHHYDNWIEVAVTSI